MPDELTNEKPAAEPQVVTPAPDAGAVTDDAAAEKLFGESATSAEAQRTQRELGIPSPAARVIKEVKPESKADEKPVEAKPDAADVEAKAAADKKAVDDAKAAEDAKSKEDAVDPLQRAEDRAKAVKAEHEQAESDRVAQEKAEKDATASREQEGQSIAKAVAGVKPDELRIFALDVMKDVVVGKDDKGDDIKAPDEFARLTTTLGESSVNTLLAMLNSFAFVHARNQAQAVAGRLQQVAERLDVRDRTEKHETVVKGFENGSWAEGIAGYADKKPEELAHPEFRKIEKSAAFWDFLKKQSQYVQDGVVKYADPVAIHEVLTAYERKTGKTAAAKPSDKQEPDAVEQARKKKAQEDELHTHTARSRSSDRGARQDDGPLSDEDAAKQFNEAAKEARKAL